MPFFDVQYGPSGPSVTYGMRSFSAADALPVKRSGGIQGMSMWVSAEIRVYFIGVSFRGCPDGSHGDPALASAPPATPGAGRQTLPSALRLAARALRRESWLGCRGGRSRPPRSV